jgi:hypothetical protein
MHDDLAPITPLSPPLDHASTHEPVYQLNDRVMADLETFGEHAHRHRLVSLEALDLEEGEVLLRLHPGSAGRDLAHPEKPSDLITQIGEGPIVQTIRGGT